jgi:hypothetical protein
MVSYTNNATLVELKLIMCEVLLPVDCPPLAEIVIDKSLLCGIDYEIL